jgi:stress-induced morphogen
VIELEEVRRRLLLAFPRAEIEVLDLTGTKDHYQARIVWSEFQGRSLIEQHQLVYRALGEAMNGPIHALALKTYTPESWRKLKGESA